ncbi:MAG: Do family serine endopeptidase [Mailhella sp.]|nr:Do family serine endopeptidase [Mailhella sp.]
MKAVLKQAALAVAATALLTVPAEAALPEFAPLVKTAGPAVVNISTEREVSSPVMDMFDIPGMERFFEPFGGNPFGGGRGKRAPQKRRSTAPGSGFIISADGYIVTHNHVVEGADRVTVDFGGDTSSSLPAKVPGTDADTDIALLKVEAPRKLPVLRFGDSDAMEVGAWVLAIGNPLGFSNTVTAGILSAKGRDIHAGPFDNFLQTDASINPGNSGGPLINMSGEVIGINTAISASGQGIGFAIPSNLASKIIDDLREGRKVSRGWLGVTIQDLDENTAKALGIKGTKGAIIGSVMPDEPAARAGLKAGDVIVRVNGKAITGASELTRSIAGLKAGSKADLVVMRGGEEVKTTVTLGERSGHTGSAAGSGDGDTVELGLKLKPLTADDARALQIAKDVKGLLVTDVLRGGAAEEAGLRQGDVIISANLTPVEKLEELSSIVRRDGKARGAVMLQVNRRGQTSFVTVNLEKK